MYLIGRRGVPHKENNLLTKTPFRLGVLDFLHARANLISVAVINKSVPRNVIKAHDNLFSRVDLALSGEGDSEAAAA